MARMLYPKAHRKFHRIRRNVKRAKSKATTTSSRLSLMSTISAAATATSVPAPMAMPTSAAVRAGESLMPSPTMATTVRFPSCRCRCSACCGCWCCCLLDTDAHGESGGVTRSPAGTSDTSGFPLSMSASQTASPVCMPCCPSALTQQSSSACHTLTCAAAVAARWAPPTSSSCKLLARRGACTPSPSPSKLPTFLAPCASAVRPRRCDRPDDCCTLPELYQCDLFAPFSCCHHADWAARKPPSPPTPLSRLPEGMIVGL
mmetsp:Transcript_22979/g.63476  ORF Transcript_22979/g.63476 Transcript_22979/m.63476 type:complete len:260 (+) Transcript_22979:1060-1839(+)